jgi:hypothetical protein
MMTCEEVNSVMGYYTEHKISHKKRLEELEIISIIYPCRVLCKPRE